MQLSHLLVFSLSRWLKLYKRNIFYINAFVQSLDSRRCRMIFQSLERMVWWPVCCLGWSIWYYWRLLVKVKLSYFSRIQIERVEGLCYGLDVLFISRQELFVVSGLLQTVLRLVYVYPRRVSRLAFCFWIAINLMHFQLLWWRRRC